MLLDYAVKRPGSDDDAAQARVRVNVSASLHGNGEMELTGPGGEQQHIAECNRIVADGKAQRRRVWQPVRKRGQPQPITLWQSDWPPNPPERHFKQADAIDPGGRIASVQAKAGADQRKRSLSQRGPAHCCGEG